NLKQLGLAIMIYANENKGVFPRTRYDSANEESVTAFTGASASNPFGKAKPLQFPAGRDVSNFSNFTSLKSLSYSYLNAFPSKAAIAKGFKANFTLTSEFAIMADLNPGGDALAKLDAHAGV